MSIIDWTDYTVSCFQCGAKENVRIRDEAGEYSLSVNWEKGREMKFFNTTWEGEGGVTEPKLITATCKACGAEAHIKME